MPTSRFVVYKLAATRAQIRLTSGVALALFLVFIVAIFERSHRVDLGLAYIPFTSALLIMADWITAALLLAQARALRESSLAVLAAGFFLTGLLVVLRVLSVPSFVAPVPGVQAPLLFYLASHAPLPLAVMANAWLGRSGDQPEPPAPVVTRCLVGAILLLGGLILAVTTVETTLALNSPVFLMGAGVLVLTIAAMAMLGRDLRSELDLWLMLALWGWLLEVALIALESPGGSAAWYAARFLGLVSGLFVLFTLIAETNKLYGQTVHELEDHDHERERRFLIGNAIAGSVAHELRQPLAVILLTAQTAQRYPEGQSGEMARSLEEIISSSHWANDIIKSTRDMFGGQGGARRPVDVVALVQRTLDMIAGKAHARKISLSLAVEGTPNPVSVNTVQIQQALLNLLHNAIEALGRVRGRPRTLHVRCIANQGQDLIIRVEDNGLGIEPDDRKKIFTPFFTTRKEGSGLGLMIANLALEAHGGQISVEPLSPFGTAFVIRLPQDESGVAGQSPLPPHNPPTASI